MLPPPNHDPLTFTPQKLCFSLFRAFRCRVSLSAQGDTFVVVGFVETPGPIRLLQKNTFSRNAVSSRRQARFTLLGSPWFPLGCHWVSLGSPWVPLVFADSITLLIHLASRVPFGSPWVLFGFLCFPLGSPWVPSGPPLGPLGHPNVTFT